MVDVRIDDNLNLVMPIRRADGVTMHVHSTPISAEVFANSYEPIARVFNKIYTGGIGMYAGPRVAYFALRDLCLQNSTWEGANGVENTLCNEIWRLTNILMPGANGWETLTFSDVLRGSLFTDREIQEVKNILVFFTVNCSMHKREVMHVIMASSGETWEARVTSLNCMGFKNSLPISTGTDSTGGTAAG